MTNYQANPPVELLAGYGCTAEEWRTLRNIGLGMVAAGASKDTTPLRAYGHQRYAALNKRGIEWQLSLMEWWGIWQASGRWAERGVGRGYMMCRKGDVGPYAVGNVYIGPGQVNLSEASRKHDLPLGVSPMRKSRLNPYRAVCWVAGKQRHLGCFPTAEEAHRAYLAAVEADLAMRQAA